MHQTSGFVVSGLEEMCHRSGVQGLKLKLEGDAAHILNVMCKVTLDWHVW